MSLFKRGPSAPERPDVTSPEETLGQDELLRHLDDEVWRSVRYGRPLVIVCMAPRMLTGERLTAGERSMAIAALRASLRRSDVAGEAGESVFVAVLPETYEEHGQATAFRLRSELSLRSAGTRQLNWQMSATSRTDEESGGALLLVGLQGMQG